MGHDPGEMLTKIDELEKGLPHGNRPEVLYARSHLLMAETMAKLLFVFIDISKKLDRVIDHTIASLTQPNVEHDMNDLHERVKARIELQKSIPKPSMASMDDTPDPAGKNRGVSSHVDEDPGGELPGTFEVEQEKDETVDSRQLVSTAQEEEDAGLGMFATDEEADHVASRKSKEADK